MKYSLIIITALVLILFSVYLILQKNALEDEENNEQIRPIRFSRETPQGWTDSPSLSLIPDTAISGFANGKVFEAKSVFFEPLFGKWSMVISDKDLESPLNIITGAQSINIRLDEKPDVNKIIQKDLSYGGGYFQIMRKDNPEETVSWNSENTYIIKFTEWEAREWDPQGDLFQYAGRASGKIFISYTGCDSGNFDDAFVAGTFTDAVIRYLGEPELEY